MKIKNTFTIVDDQIYRFLGMLALLGVFCFIFVSAHRALFDLDIWLHFKTGEFILQNKFIPVHDIFSFSLQAKPWIDHEWLFQVIVWLIYSHWSINGLIALQSYVIVASFFVLFLIGHKYLKSYFETAVILLLPFYASIMRFNIRPDIFSLLFFSLYLYILRFWVENKLVWLLVLIQVIWVNFHGYFFLGPLLVLIFIVSELICRTAQLNHFKLPGLKPVFTNKAYQRLKLVFVVLILASLLNPGGVKNAFYPFFVLKEIISGKSLIFFKNIQELTPTFQLLSSRLHFYYLIFISSFVFLLLNIKKFRILDLFLLLFFFGFSLTSRNIAFSSFVAYLIIVSYFSQSMQKLSAGVKLKTRGRQLLSYFLKYFILVAFIVWLVFKISDGVSQSYYDMNDNKVKSSLADIDTNSFPVATVDFIVNNDICANIFNDFNSGAYLIGRASPKIKVFIDGRTELYGPEFFKEYKDILSGDVVKFDKLVKKFNITAAMFNLSTKPMPNIIKYLYRHPDWNIVFFDENGLLFLRRVPQHEDKIKKFKIDFKKYSVTPADLMSLGLRDIYPSYYLRRSALFNLLGENDLAIAEAKEALRVRPNLAQGFNFIGKAYMDKKIYPEAFENFRAAAILYPSSDEYRFDLGVALKELKANREAAVIFSWFVKNRPNNPLYYFQLGDVFFQEGKKLNNKSKIIEGEAEIMKAQRLSLKSPKENQAEIQNKLKEIENYLANKVN